MEHLTAEDLEEIRMRYRQAKDQDHHILILSEMFLISKEDVRKIVGMPTGNELKKAVIQDMRGGLTIGQASRKYGVADSTAYYWAVKEGIVRK